MGDSMIYKNRHELIGLIRDKEITSVEILENLLSQIKKYTE